MIEKYRFIVANITWNEDGWRNLYINPKAGHRYARENPGHESLNFDFEKEGLDDEEHIHGYVQWVGNPKKLAENGAIFFYTKNLENDKNEIIGVYGDSKIIEPSTRTKYHGFENDELVSNIRAKKSLTTLFPIPLNANNYSKGRLVPQSGFKYIDDNLARQIIADEITELKKSGIRREEFKKFKNIFEFVTGNSYEEEFDKGIDYDSIEQNEIENISKRSKKTKSEIVNNLRKLKPEDPELVNISGKSYKRDNKTIVELKILRDYKCQICDNQIKKRDGSFYVEAAHIEMKSKKGAETPENILILCPNHHKEFDLGNRKVIEHSKEKIIFILNEKKYSVNLSLD